MRGGRSIDGPLEKTTFKKLSLIRVKYTMSLSDIQIPLFVIAENSK